MISLLGEELLIATHNKGKLEEISALLVDYNIKVSSAKDYNLMEPAETENTFVGNARIKAHTASKSTGLPALSDDSGVEVEALNNLPGVYTADWAEVNGGRDNAWKLINSTELISITANLGDTRSTITHPATTTHSRLSQQERDSSGITDNLIRIAVGLEDIDDLKLDISTL